MTIIVLAGGDTESEISHKSGANISKILDSQGVKNIIIDPSAEHKKELKTNEVSAAMSADQILYLKNQIDIIKPKAVLNTLHGGWGESGFVQRVMEEARVKWNGSSSKACHIMMDKELCKAYARQIGVLCSSGGLMTREQYEDYHQYNHMVKVNFGAGSSLGIQKIHSAQEKEYLIQQFWTDNEKRLVEECVVGREYTVAVYNNRILGGIEITFDSDWCDYAVKYGGESNLEHLVESDKFKYGHDQAKMASINLYRHLKCSGLVRFDFIIDQKTKQAYFIEANPNPGMTDVSLVPDILKVTSEDDVVGLDLNMDKLISAMIEDADY